MDPPTPGTQREPIESLAANLLPIERILLTNPAVRVYFFEEWDTVPHSITDPTHRARYEQAVEIIKQRIFILPTERQQDAARHLGVFRVWRRFRMQYLYHVQQRAKEEGRLVYGDSREYHALLQHFDNLMYALAIATE